MQTGTVIKRLCGLIAAVGLGAELFYLSLTASERAAVDERVVRSVRDLIEKSVDIKERLIEKVARVQSD